MGVKQKKKKQKNSTRTLKGSTLSLSYIGAGCRATGLLLSSRWRLSFVVCVAVAAVHHAGDCCWSHWRLLFCSCSRSESPFAEEIRVGLGRVSPTPVAPNFKKKKKRYSAITAIPQRPPWRRHNRFLITLLLTTTQ